MSTDAYANWERLNQQWYALADPFGLLKQDFKQPITAFHSELNKMFDPFGITAACLATQKAWLEHPQQLANRMAQFNIGLWTIQLQTWERLSGFQVQDAIQPIDYDERFQDPAWLENPYLDAMKEYYLLITRWLEDTIYATPDIDAHTQDKAGFWVRQWLNAVAPSNFFWTNPIAVQRFIETHGQSAVAGFTHLLADMRHRTIRMVDETAFKVGDNLANTPGVVVYRNALFELIQYRPTTEQVHTVPLVIIPPWINKFYILDLGAKKSLVRYLVAQGHTVFMLSWKNPTAEMRNTTMDDYMLKGLLEAVNVARDISAVPQVHAVGYCIGGIMLSALMAWLNDDEQAAEHCPIGSWSLFTTLVDFATPGEIGVFIDEQSIAHLEKLMLKEGFLSGQQMADSFRILRSNSLVWHYFVHNYLYGEDLPQFDVLFWNMDNTRLPAAMHSFYLREFYLNNKLCLPNGLTLGGRQLDLGKIQQPLYVVGTEQDHIAPWQETFKVCQLVNGSVRYVLATSGHIMGIISPPVDPPKRRYWVGDATGAEQAETWRDAMAKVPGSWWIDWHEWLLSQAGTWQTPPSLGNATYPVLMDAPGQYVLET